MGAGLQFAAFLCICWLIRGVITHPNEDDSKKLSNKPPNPNNPGRRDFYFEEQRTNGDNIKTGRAISQSAWSKEEKEQTQTVENKTETQANDEFSLKSVLSYMLNMVQELKKDIFGIKEMVNSQDNFGEKNKQNEMQARKDALKSGDSPEYSEFKNEKPQPRSNYLTEYYQKNGIEFFDDEEDDAFENFSDQSDDSSHQPNDEVNIQEININNNKLNQNDDLSHKSNDGINKQEIITNNKNTKRYKCMRITRKPGTYSSEVKKITAISTSQTKIPEENVKKFNNNNENGKDNDFNESTTKPSAAEQNNLKSSREENENLVNAPSTFRMGKCVKKNNRNFINNLNEKNSSAKKPLKSVEQVTTKSPQNENSDKANSKGPNQSKTSHNLPKGTSPTSKIPGKNSKSKNGSNFDNKSGVQLQSTTLPSQNSKDFTYPEKVENTNEPYTTGIFPEKPAYRKQQVQNTSPKPADEKQFQNNAKSLKSTVRENENATVSFPNHKMSNKAYTLSTEIKGDLKESKDKKPNVISSRISTIYNENNPDSKFGRQSNNIDSDNTIQSTTSGNTINMDKVNKNILNNFTDKKGEKGSSKNNELEKLNANTKDKSYPENEGNSETKQPKEQQTNDGIEPERSLKNKRIKDSKPANGIKEKDDSLSSATSSDLNSSQDSKSEFQNYDAEGFGKPQESQESNENLSENDKTHEISPDEEYEYEEDTEDSDTSEEIMNMQDIQDQESEVNINNEKYDNNDEMYPTTVLINESEISEQTGNAMKEESKESQISEQTGNSTKEESKEQYGTFLEYIYKHSNNSFFQSLKSQYNNSSPGEY